MALTYQYSSTMRTKHIFKDDDGSLISFSSEEVARMELNANAIKTEMARIPADAKLAIDTTVKK